MGRVRNERTTQCKGALSRLHLGHYGMGSLDLGSTGTPLKSIQNASWNFWPETLSLPQRVSSPTKVDLPVGC